MCELAQSLLQTEGKLQYSTWRCSDVAASGFLTTMSRPRTYEPGMRITLEQCATFWRAIAAFFEALDYLPLIRTSSYERTLNDCYELRITAGVRQEVTFLQV